MGSGIDKGVCAWLQDARSFSRSSPVTTERRVRIVVFLPTMRGIASTTIWSVAIWHRRPNGVLLSRHFGYDLVVADYEV